MLYVTNCDFVRNGYATVLINTCPPSIVQVSLCMYILSRERHALHEYINFVTLILTQM